MKKLFIALILFGMAFSLNAQSDNVSKYRNVLDIKNIPSAAKDYKSFSFLDLGAWFGFALPPDSVSSFYGSFIGPYAASDGKWLGKSLAQLKIINASTGTGYDWSKARLIENSFYPGTLLQRYLLDNLYIELQLIFISNRTAVIRAGVRTMDDTPAEVNLLWKGDLFESTNLVKGSIDGIFMEFEKSPRRFVIQTEESAIPELIVSNNLFQITAKSKLKLSKSALQNTYLFVTQYENEKELYSASNLIREFAGYPKKFYDFNRTRWNGYLNKVLATGEDFGVEPEYRQGAVKCLLTLINNWKSPMGDLKHDGIVPSYSHHYFTGFWAWDSWKHAAALAYFEPELAKNQMRAMFHFQNSKGMIPDCVFIDSTQNNWLDTKPPLAAWGVLNIFEATKDFNFIREFYPKLVKYHKWWYAERDHDKNGLCEYGATKDSLIAALWESGMDNAIRFDDAKLLKNGDGAYSLNQESVDLNSYLYAEKLFLSKMADTLGLKNEGAAFIAEATALKRKIQESFFDNKTKFYFDITIDRKKHINVYGPEGLIPLWAMAATQTEAESIQKVIFDSDKFYTRVPFPTISADHPKLDINGYWRGPVWLDQAYFGIMGLRYYGYVRQARKLTERIFDNAKGYINSGLPINENYNPFTGEGLNANNFSWSAAHLLLLYWGR